jgi:hypothetical protein
VSEYALLMLITMNNDRPQIRAVSKEI